MTFNVPEYVAVIVPIFNRDEHVEPWIENVLPELEATGMNYRVAFIRQDTPDLRLLHGGVLCNLGAYLHADASHYLFHDVDLSPETPGSVDYLPPRDGFDVARLVGRSPNINAGRPTSPTCMAGIVYITRDGLHRINGWSNRILGWGGLDDMVEHRVRSCSLKIEPRDGVFQHRSHGPSEASHYKYNLARLYAARDGTYEHTWDGVNEMAEWPWRLLRVVPLQPRVTLYNVTWPRSYYIPPEPAGSPIVVPPFQPQEA